METTAHKIREYAASLPEGTTLAAKELLHLGNRATIDQALSRLVKRGELMRAGRGIYVHPVETRFGLRAPTPEKVTEAIGSQRGETIVRHGAAAANALGLTTQVPTHTVYLTSGRSRKLELGGQTVELQHAPLWQLVLGNSPAGDAVRVLAWAGPKEAGRVVEEVRRKLSAAEQAELVSARGRMPTWMAQEVSALARA